MTSLATFSQALAMRQNAAPGLLTSDRLHTFTVTHCEALGTLNRRTVYAVQPDNATCHASRFLGAGQWTHLETQLVGE